MKKNFHEDYAWEQQQSHAPYQDRLVRLLFPSHTKWSLNTDPISQRQGIDRWVEFAGGKFYKIDDKYRRVFYPDYLVELVSNDRTGTVGWALKNTAPDYICHIWPERDRADILSNVGLQKALAANVDHWVNRYKPTETKNAADFGDYSTWWIAIPMEVIRHQVSWWSVRYFVNPANSEERAGLYRQSEFVRKWNQQAGLPSR